MSGGLGLERRCSRPVSDALAESERSRLRPVSISYPEGDPGREDELIRAGQPALGCRPSTGSTATKIPLLDGLEERAGLTDEPPVHLYELWNRELARGSPRRRRPRCARRLRRRQPVPGLGCHPRRPAPDWPADRICAGERGPAEGWAGSTSRRRVCSPCSRTRWCAGESGSPGDESRGTTWSTAPADWVRGDFAAAHGLRDRALDTLRSAAGDSLAQTENILFVNAPYGGGPGGYMRGVLLQEGVEARSPLLDLRVVEFALRRPVAERADWKETKILLRRAMRGPPPASRSWLPGHTAPEARRGFRGGACGRPTRRCSRDSSRSRSASPTSASSKQSALRAAADRWTNAGDEVDSRGTVRRDAGRVLVARAGAQRRPGAGPLRSIAERVLRLSVGMSAAGCAGRFRRDSSVVRGGDSDMYNKPALQRFGSLRDLTLIGWGCRRRRRHPGVRAHHCGHYRRL